MRRSGFVLPALSMGLLYSSIYVGLIIVNLRGSASDGRGDFGVLLHFALIALSAVGLYFAVRKGVGRLRPLAALLTLAGCVCVVLPFFPGGLTERIFNGHFPIVGVCMALFMPVGLFLFFRTVPTGKTGLYFALVISGSELLWALVFPLLGGPLLGGPLLGGMSGGASSQLGLQAFHLFSLCSWMLGCAGLCLAVSLARIAREDAAATPDAARTDEQAETAKPEKRAALFLIFAAGVGVFAMMGLCMGMLMPKTAVLPELIGIVHFALLFLLPLAGRMLDENPGRLMRIGVLGLTVVFILALLHEHGLIGRMPLFYTLNFMQQVMLLTAYTATARLLRAHAAFPLVITLAHCLYVTHTGGVALRGLVEAVPYGVTVSSLLLASEAAFCLWRFHRLLEKEPELWAAPQRSHEARLAAFAARYGLSERETLVMEMLAQGRSSEEIAASLAVTANTVRTYVRRLMHKTGTDNRAGLLARYAAPTR